MTEWIVGAALLAAGVAGSLWIKRRRFYRRNPAGLQVFRAFGASLTIGAFEGLALLLSPDGSGGVGGRRVGGFQDLRRLKPSIARDRFQGR